MAKNEESRLKSGRSPWKSHVKSLFEDTCSETKSSQSQDLAAAHDYAVLCKESVEEETQEDEKPPPSKRRRKKITIPEGFDKVLEKEIEKQWNTNAEEKNLTVRNVKNILKSVITNKYVVDMVRQTIEKGGVTDLPFEPKLTRAKTKELLQQNPDRPLAPVVGLLTPIKKPLADINPEIELLINHELSEDSSDEEYNPENEDEPSDDEESRGETSLASDLDSLPATPASLHLSAPLTPSQECSQEASLTLPLENVGQRTRSKLDLNRLPLESIEQMFQPPDVTEDMYEKECDNPDWEEFLKEFTQPLPQNEVLDDDCENDPEYNILEDEVNLKAVDKEEMRKDRAVKITRKEVNALMQELFEYTELPSSDEEDINQTTESLAALEESIMKETEERQRREELEKQEAETQQTLRKREAQRGFLPSQMFLLAQQLRQHVQLTTQHYMQTYQHPRYNCYATICKTMLRTLDGFKEDKLCSIEIENLAPALETVVEWENLHSNPESGEQIRTFVKEQIQSEKANRKSKHNTFMEFPPQFMLTMLQSEVFHYPLLLPNTPFRTTFKMAGPNSFTRSEDMLLAICLEQVTRLMEKNRRRYKRQRLVDKANLIYSMSIPRSSPSHIARRISTLTCQEQINPVKCYFQTGEAPKVLHYVIHVQKGVKLINQPFQLLPEKWKNFVRSLKLSEEKEKKTTVSVSETMPIASKQAINMRSTTIKNSKVSSINRNLEKNHLESCANSKFTNSGISSGPGPSKLINFKKPLTTVSKEKMNNQKTSPTQITSKTKQKTRTVKSQAPTICKAMLSQVDLVPRPVKSSLKQTMDNGEEKEKPLQNTPRVRFKLKTDPPKVRFAIKYLDRAGDKSTKIAKQRRLWNRNKQYPKKSSSSESSPEEETGFQNGIDSDSSEKCISPSTSKLTGNGINKSACTENSKCMKLLAPTLTISHSPKPPSTVKLKKSILKNKSANQIEIPINECSLSCPELPTNSIDF